MLRRIQIGVCLAILTGAGGWTLSPDAAQGIVRQILARARVFPDIGPGASVLKRDSAGRYYVLAAPATAVAIYAAEGRRLGQIPNANSRGVKIAYAQDFDLDAAGRLFVADRGANAVKIFEPDGSPDAMIRVTAPLSVVALPDGDCAVTALRPEPLVSVFDRQGKLTGSFGDNSGTPGGVDRNPSLNRGRIYSDRAGHIYFVFTDLPDPTIRKYDRYGYAAHEISLPSADFMPQPQARRWDTVTIQGSSDARPTKPVIRALGVDPATQEVWAAIGDILVHFDKDGNRRAAHHTATKEGVPIEPDSILIEPDRILLAADPLGIFDFAIPEKQLAAPSQR
jgi:hypothetical protein